MNRPSSLFIKLKWRFSNTCGVVRQSRLTIKSISCGRNNNGRHSSTSLVLLVVIVVDFRRIYVVSPLVSFVERDPTKCSVALLCYANGFILYFSSKNLHDLRYILFLECTYRTIKLLTSKYTYRHSYLILNQDKG